MIRKPNLFIVGEPKSGTSSLHYNLNKHPNIFMSNPKETGFFASDLMNEYEKYHGKKSKYSNFKEYSKIFKNSNKKHIVVGESSTIYLYSKVAAYNIFSYNPNAKIIVSFREPSSFLYSYNKYAIFKQREKYQLKKALSVEKNRKKWQDLPDIVLRPSNLFYSERLKYSEHLNRFLKYFNRNQIKVIIFENFIDNENKIYKEIFNFLNLNNELNIKYEHYNKSKSARFILLRKWLQQGKFSKITCFLPKKLKNNIKNLFYRVSSKPSSNKFIDPKYKLQLKKKYKKEVIKLDELLHNFGLISDDKNLIKFWGYDKI